MCGSRFLSASSLVDASRRKSPRAKPLSFSASAIASRNEAVTGWNPRGEIPFPPLPTKKPPHILPSPLFPMASTPFFLAEGKKILAAKPFPREERRREGRTRAGAIHSEKAAAMPRLRGPFLEGGESFPRDEKETFFQHTRTQVTPSSSSSSFAASKHSRRKYVKSLPSPPPPPPRFLIPSPSATTGQPAKTGQPAAAGPAIAAASSMRLLREIDVLFIELFFRGRAFPSPNPSEGREGYIG